MELNHYVRRGCLNGVDGFWVGPEDFQILGHRVARQAELFPQFLQSGVRIWRPGGSSILESEYPLLPNSYLPKMAPNNGEIKSALVRYIKHMFFISNKKTGVNLEFVNSWGEAPALPGGHLPSRALCKTPAQWPLRRFPGQPLRGGVDIPCAWARICARL